MFSRETIISLERARTIIRKINQRKKAKKDTTELELTYTKLCDTLEPFIASIEDEELRYMISNYYINGESWTLIGERLYQHRTTCEKKVKRFIERG